MNLLYSINNFSTKTAGFEGRTLLEACFVSASGANEDKMVPLVYLP